MKTICVLICDILIAFAIYIIISILWYAAEMALYGTSQQSIIDSFVNVYISTGLSEKLFSASLGGKE